MLYRITRKTTDNQQIERLTAPRTPCDDDSFDYRDIIVKKPWGYEYLVFQNPFVSIWMLHIARKKKTSMHCHPRKKTALVLLCGNATYHHLEGAIDLKPLSGIIIEEGAFHSTEASSFLPILPVSENGIWVMEIESPPVKTDLVRLKDEYGRSGASYEGLDSMVFNPRDCLELRLPPEGKVFTAKFFDCIFSVAVGRAHKAGRAPTGEVLVSVIGSVGEQGAGSLPIGEVTTYDDFSARFSGGMLKNHVILTIEREIMRTKVSDYVFSRVADLGVREVFAVSGGGAMHLVDSLGRNERLTYIATHHEQAAAMAAEAHARISGVPGVALVTSGPGGTNALTGVCGAWIDSIPSIFISGQVTRDTLIEESGLRQFGIQESNIVEIVRSVTKYAVTVKDPRTIRYHLEKAIHLATTGRPGPVWLDIPLDVQSALVDVDELEPFRPEEEPHEEKRKALEKQVSQTLKLLRAAKRPVLIGGYGLRLSGCGDAFVTLARRLGVPVIMSWTASDLFDFHDDLFIGRSGIMGDRAGNFAVQNADLLLIVGSRMSIPQVGYNYRFFAREAKKVMVDIDARELEKGSLSLDLPIRADAGDFVAEMMRQLEKWSVSLDCREWLSRCRGWKERYPVALAEYRDVKDSVNSFHFVELLSEKLGPDAVVVTDMGTSFTCTMQTFRVKKGQRLFTSSGHASMGFGLPGSIGACLARGKRKTILVTGDGGLQMNIQELQTVVHYRLPIIIFVLNNAGYLTIKLMQQNHFGCYVGSDPASGVSCPDIVKVAKAYGIKGTRVACTEDLHRRINRILAMNEPYVCEIMMAEDQQLIPRVSSLKRPDGSIVSKPLEDLFPFLDREEFLANMIVKPVEVLGE